MLGSGGILLYFSKKKNPRSAARKIARINARSRRLRRYTSETSRCTSEARAPLALRPRRGRLSVRRLTGSELRSCDTDFVHKRTDSGNTRRGGVSVAVNNALSRAQTRRHRPRIFSQQEKSIFATNDRRPKYLLSAIKAVEWNSLTIKTFTGVGGILRTCIRNYRERNDVHRYTNMPPPHVPPPGPPGPGGPPCPQCPPHDPHHPPPPHGPHHHHPPHPHHPPPPH
ncbi:hypothetical protein EVAR_41636_1 [Eumeta japonica]|uniref:Uncharacterized protein n=1 Tax=Eumeta variegata TaxID=151549 RepID=A0A4C1X3L8_EUMVA|nr:hypothetical protein EVAR_41636_1 [Eumeta japonica]